MHTHHEPHDRPGTLRRLIAAALEADVSPSRIEELIRIERRREPDRCPECNATMRAEDERILRCSNCGVTSATKPL